MKMNMKSFWGDQFHILVQFSRDDNFYSTDKKFELNILVRFNEPKTNPLFVGFTLIWL